MTDSAPLSYRNPLTERRRQERTPFRAARRERERVKLLGQYMDFVRPEEVLHHVETWVEARRKVIIANHNLNSLALLKRVPQLQRFYDRADLIEVDSTPCRTAPSSRSGPPTTTRPASRRPRRGGWGGWGSSGCSV